MMPPPRTTSRFGTSVCASSPVESTQRCESRPSIGGRSGNEPVAMIADLKVTSSPPSTAIVFASLKRAVALHPLDAVRLEEGRDALRHLLDDAGLPLVRGRRSRAGARRRLTPSLANVSSRLLQRERGLHPRLRRDAADAQAGAAELGLLLDAGDLRAELRRADRGGVAAGAAAEDGDVTLHRSSDAVSASIDAVARDASSARPRSVRTDAGDAIEDTLATRG